MSDLISRKAAIDAIERLILPQTKGKTAAEEINCVAWRCAINCAEEMIGHLPTIDPVKHGKWIKMSDADGVYWTCSECGEDLPRVSHYNPQFDLFPRLESIDKTNCCPNCGARME